jgi:hypothetical protein
MLKNRMPAEYRTKSANPVIAIFCPDYCERNPKGEVPCINEPIHGRVFAASEPFCEIL